MVHNVRVCFGAVPTVKADHCQPESESQRDRETETQRDRETESIETVRETERQRDRETERQRA